MEAFSKFHLFMLVTFLLILLLRAPAGRLSNSNESNVNAALSMTMLMTSSYDVDFLEILAY